MAVNTAMWGKALRVIPRITKAEWDTLDTVSRWLIASRAAVFIMTAIASAIGGLLAYKYDSFSWIVFALTLLGLVFAHATNNMLNDYVDFSRGIDHNNYYRSLYGPQPLEHGLLTKPQFLTYIIATGLIALGLGIYPVLAANAWLFLVAGLFFLLFYTWPLKYYGLGEPSVVLVWGPLMVGGTFFVVSGGAFNATVAAISIIYALGPTSVLFGKHTDKLTEDRAKGVNTLPVLIGQKTARYATIFMWLLQFVLIGGLIYSGSLSLYMLVVLAAVPKLISTVKVFAKPRPAEAPAWLKPGVWPLFLSAHAFAYNRQFGLLFLAGLLADVFIAG